MGKHKHTRTRFVRFFSRRLGERRDGDGHAPDGNESEDQESSASRSDGDSDDDDEGVMVVGPVGEEGDDGDEDNVLMLALAKSLSKEDGQGKTKESKWNKKSKDKFASKTDKLDLAVRFPAESPPPRHACLPPPRPFPSLFLQDSDVSWQAGVLQKTIQKLPDFVVKLLLCCQFLPSRVTFCNHTDGDAGKVVPGGLLRSLVSIGGSEKLLCT